MSEFRYPTCSLEGYGDVRAEPNPGEEVWVRAVVTSKSKKGVRVGLRVASRVGSSYAGSSTYTSHVIDGVVRRTVEVPFEDVVCVIQG